jgi:hypothetical protein
MGAVVAVVDVAVVWLLFGFVCCVDASGCIEHCWDFLSWWIVVGGHADSSIPPKPKKTTH